MSSDLSLGCYYRTHGNLRAFSTVEVPPDATVERCIRLILPNYPTLALPVQIDLYKYPLGEYLSLEALESNLGEMSVSTLGEPLNPFRSLQTIFGSNPVEGHLHLVVVDRSIILTVSLWIPSAGRRLDVEVKGGHTPEFLLRIIKEKVPGFGDKAHIAFYKTSYRNVQDLDVSTRGQLLPESIDLFTMFDDVPFSMFPCIVVVREERKHHLSWNLLDRTIDRKLNLMAPSSLGVSEYCSLQADSDERLLDYRRHTDQLGQFPEKDLPPPEVLFKGFGIFSDIYCGAYTPSETAETIKMMEDVQRFMEDMAQVFSGEELRRQQGLALLNEIFPASGARSKIEAGDVMPTSDYGLSLRTDGHSSYKPDGIPCIITEFKNEAVGTAIPVVELAGCYSRIVRQVAVRRPTAVAGSRLPTLGITVVGPAVTLYALAHVGSVVYVPLAPTLWCLPVEGNGSDLRQFYAAFSAATALVASIDEEFNRLMDETNLPISLEQPFYPQIDRLTRYPDSDLSINLQITGIVAKDLSRTVYEASSSSGDLVIKLTRSYSIAMHAFCASLGYAPKLLAFERLPGGIFAVAMERLKGESLGSLLFILARCRGQWILDLEKIVKSLHDEGFVHGDLRPPNIFCTEDRVMLLDFDWGGKAGEARYPHPRLNPELLTGRDMSSLNITMEDDIRVLKRTVEYIKELPVRMES